MPLIPSLALAIKALISFVVLGVSITAINAVGFSNDIYTKGSTGIFFTPPVSPPAVEFGQSSDCPACLFVDLDNLRLAPTPTLPLKISWTAPSMVQPKLSPTSIAPPPGNISTAPTLVSNFSKAEEFTLWCKKLSTSIFRRDAAWIIVSGVFLTIFVTTSTYLSLHRLPLLRSYLRNAQIIGRSILSQGQLALEAKQSLAILMALLRERLAGPTILAFAIFRHLELSYYIELERRSEWKAAMKQRFMNEANERLNDIFWEWQVAEEKRMSDWQAVETKRIRDKANALIQEHAREYVQQEKVKLFLKVTGIIDNHRRVPTRMRSELHKLWAAEDFDRVCTSDTTSQGEVQQPDTDQRLPFTENTSEQEKKEGEAKQAKAADADGDQAAEANQKHEEAATPKSELATVSAEVTPEVGEDGAEAHQSQKLSGLGADMSRPKENVDEGEARGFEHTYGPTEQTVHFDDDDDDEKKADVQQSEGALVSQNLAVKLEEGRDDGQSQQRDDADGKSEERAQIDADEETRLPRIQNMGPKDEGNEGDPVVEDVRQQADNELARWRALNKEQEENIAGIYRMIVNTEDDGATSAKASDVRRSVQEGAKFCIKWYDAQISWLNDATGDPKGSSPDLDPDTLPPGSATTTKEDTYAWYARRLHETQVCLGRLAMIIDYKEKRLMMKEKFVSFGWDLRTSTESFDDTDSKNDETGREEAQDLPSTPQGSYPATEIEVQPHAMSKTKKRNLERKRAKAKKVKEALESQP